jgi:hypothetical protein
VFFALLQLRESLLLHSFDSLLVFLLDKCLYPVRKKLLKLFTLLSLFLIDGQRYLYIRFQNFYVRAYRIVDFFKLFSYIRLQRLRGLLEILHLLFRFKYICLYHNNFRRNLINLLYSLLDLRQHLLYLRRQISF